MQSDPVAAHCSTWNSIHQTCRILFHVEQFSDRRLLLTVCQALALGGQSCLVVWLAPTGGGDNETVGDESPLQESEVGPLIRSLGPGVDTITELCAGRGVAWMAKHGPALLLATHGQYDWIFIASHDLVHAQGAAGWVDGARGLLPFWSGSSADGVAAAFDALHAVAPCLIVVVEPSTGAMAPEIYAQLHAHYASSLSQTIMTLDRSATSGAADSLGGFLDSPESPQALRAIQLAKELKDHGRS